MEVPPDSWEFHGDRTTVRSDGLEGIVAKRKADPYAAGVTWYKIKNRAYTQAEGRGDLFHGRS